MEFRWLTEEEVLSLVNPVLASRGWAELNVECCRVLGALQDGQLVEFFALQLFPLLGPLMRSDNTVRDDGATSRELARMMVEYLTAEQARGWIAIAESPVTERLCVRYDMKRVEHPVFITKG